MKLQNKLFLFFISSIVLSLITTTFFVYFILKQNNELFENEKIETALADAFELYKNESALINDTLESIIDKITVINREYSKSKILKKDILIGGEMSLFIFLLIFRLPNNIFQFTFFRFISIAKTIKTLIARIISMSCS